MASTSPRSATLALVILMLPLAAQAGGTRHDVLAAVTGTGERDAPAGPAAMGSLHWAAIQDEHDLAGRLIDRGVPIDGRDGDGRTPLMAAAAFGNAGVAALLLARGADPRASDWVYGDTPLHFAARAGRVEVAGLLLDTGVDPDVRSGRGGATPLHRAATFGHRRMIELLASRGADPDARDDQGVSPLFYASRRLRPGIVALLRGLGAKEGGLHEAVNADDVARLQALLRAGADVDRQGLGATPLHLAASKGYLGAAGILIDAGANLEAAGELGGARPLHAAALSDEPRVAELLLERGASVDTRDAEGRTPLMVAALFGSVSTAAVLLRHGADAEAIDAIHGDAAIHQATRAGQVAIVELLIAHGVDASARSAHDGETPLHYAAMKRYGGMMSLLIENGAALSARDDNGRTLLDYANRCYPGGAQFLAGLAVGE